ncbi:MAG: M81 family metallopeptidase [Spirochaetales bacterium]|nr:M81 family metallopeptidase [Spirochaetales bacterium]
MAYSRHAHYTPGNQSRGRPDTFMVNKPGKSKHLIRYTLGIIFLSASLLASSCRTMDSAFYVTPPGPVYRIAVLEFAQETNSFSPVPTTLKDFRALGIRRGEEVVQYAAEGENALSGFYSAVSAIGNGEIAVIPLFKAMAMSGGPVTREVFDAFKSEMIEGLEEAMPLDGVYLALHGAMGVEGMSDPEGDLIEAVRSVVGVDAVIGASHDLHANITERRAELADFIVGYKTNPHRDFEETGYAAGAILIRAVRGEVKPVMVVRNMRLLKGGGMTIDFLPPMNRVFRTMKRLEREPGILSTSVFMVHIWLDDQELGWTTVAVADAAALPDARQAAARAADTLADMCWAVRDAPLPDQLSAEQAVALVRRSWLARALGTTVICDVSDAVGAGAPGENAWILKAFLEHDPDLCVYIPLRDGEAARMAAAAGAGNEIAVEVGRNLEKEYNTRVKFDGKVLRVEQTEQYGTLAVVRHKGIHLILSELPTYVYDPDFFSELGLKPCKADAVVVKNLFPFRFTFMPVNRKTINVATPGTTNIDVFGLNYTSIPRPIYPLDEIDDWH